MEAYEELWNQWEKKLSDENEEIQRLHKQTTDCFERIKKNKNQYENNYEEIEKLAKERFEKILDEAEIDCETNDEKIIPPIDILEDKYQSLKSSVDEIINELKEKSADLSDKTSPYRQKLEEFFELRETVEQLKNDNLLEEKTLKNAPIRLTVKDNKLSICFQRNGKYVYGLRVDDGNRDDLWKQIKQKMNIK